MEYLWFEFAMLLAGIIVYFMYTIVFCFWFIYLVDAMKRKRSYYKATLRCIERESDLYQQMLAYNAKTELVKFVSLFCLNLVEWVGFTLSFISCIVHFVQGYHRAFPAINSSSVSEDWNATLHIPYFGIVCIVISMAIIGSLCLYLSARYAQKSWITSKRIPYWISFFLLSFIASQILVTICYTHIIGIWCDIILVIISVIFAWKQYRKLDMVIQWSVVDLSVSGNMKLLEKHVKMKFNFNRMFTIIWLGVSCMIVAGFIEAISHTVPLLRMYHRPFAYGLLCGTSIHYHLNSYANAVMYCIAGSLTILGMLFIFVPYIGYGISTMSVLLWRLFRGKAGYKTHFHVDLTHSLI